jgi:prepilin-type N-terminal cleavage/methylation domain-containing protein
MEHPKHLKRAFTLIELLVVIAIIAILAAILFPVFAQAKLAAKKTAGLNQVKQIGLATNIYLADYDDVLPGYRWSVSNASAPINPTYLAYQSAGDPRAATMASQGATTIHAIFFNQIIQPYMKNDDIFKAPTALDAWTNFQDKGTWDVGFHSYGGQNSYAANNYLLKQNVGSPAGSVEEVSNTILFIDATYYNSLPAQPLAGFCKIGGYDPTGGNASSSYYHYWKHLGNNKLNFSALGSNDPDNAGNASVIKNIESRYSGVLNITRVDSSAKAINAKALIYDLRQKLDKSMWNPLKTPCEP